MSANAPPPGAGGAHPLRPYATDSGDRNIFVAARPAPAPAAAAARSSGSSRAGSAAPVAVPQPKQQNRYVRLDDDYGDLSGAPSFRDALKGLALAGALQYTSTAIAMPFEVGKLLLQIQWVPRDDVWNAYAQSVAAEEAQRGGLKGARGASTPGAAPSGLSNEWDDDDETEEERMEMGGEREQWGEEEEQQQRDFGGEDDELSDEEEASAYFADLTSASQRPPIVRGARRPTDAAGYVVRQSIHERGGAAPRHVLPVVVRGGVWEMIKAVARGKEGYWGLFKGTLTTFIFDVATSTIQPLLSLSLSYLIPSALTPLPLPYAPYPRRTYALLVSSHLLTGFILSPLDLIRTRLVAQSTLTPHRKYSGPFDALRQILRDEGGWRTIYFHPHLFIPTLLDFTLRPALSIGAPLLIEHTLRLDNVGSPVAYALADFMVSTLALVITLPIETVRRRLQIQPRAPWGAEPPEPVGARPLPLGGSVTSVGLAAKPFKALRTCVETRPRPYLGVSEAIYRILVEETSFSPVPRHRREASTDSTAAGGDALGRSGIIAKHGNSSLGGLRSLYRGFTMGLGANAVVFALTLVSRERNPSSAGWAEI